MPTPEAHVQNKQRIFQQTPVTADSSGKLPASIEILRAGQWPESSNKGMLYITPVDLAQMAANFKAGVGVNPSLGQLPIDFMHNEWDKAAGWITDLEVVGDVLMGTVTWTDSGSAALLGGDFKMFSPSFYPGCLGEWHDPEDWDISAPNVLVGGALTNIPFFKDLQPIMASNSSQEDDRRNVIYVSADERKNMPTLDEVRVKEQSALTDEDKALLAEHEADLSADEKVKFGFQAAPETTPEVTPEAAVVVPEENKEETPVPAEQPAEAIAASVKAGTHIVMASADVKAMNEKIDAAAVQLAAYKEKDVKASVVTHLERGAIKADQVDNWTAKIIADASVEELLKALPDNAVLASANGRDEKAGDKSALDEVREEAKKLQASAKEEGKTLTIDQAYSQVFTANADLKARYELETTTA